SYRIPPLRIVGEKLFLRIKAFLLEAAPVVLVGVFVVNILFYFRLFDNFTNIFSPVMVGLFGLPKEAIVALTVGFFRKEVAAGMLVPLALSAKQLFIAAVLLSISFPCIATFVIIFKELGLKNLIKSTVIMMITGIVIGSLLNLLIIR
ncbi:MAG: ferrous iron transporter B, partial [Candidatus Omnitrophica bacterium]|nr:ferrous iron transporter B [Candidatus Omnitrophota bacterium]